MSECMNYPKNPIDFINGYAFKDEKELYTNGSELVPLFRVEQMIEHYVNNKGWIPVSERLPDDGDCRFYMCIIENHEEEEPMLCQYEEEYGFGFYHDIYDEHTLGFIDSEFKTNEELGYEKVIAWQQIPKYQPKGE